MKPKPKPKKPGRPGVPIFFVISTGEGVVRNNYWCGACSTHTRIKIGRFAHADRPEGNWGSIAPCVRCEQPVVMSSQGFDTIYRRADGSEVNPDGGNLPPGAVYACDHGRPGPDGRSLAVVLPDGAHWHIDSRASNCKLPKDEKHYCWARTGRPEDGTLNVVKGDPRDAGGGSIRTGRYHGHLRHGQLVPCGDSQT